LGRHVPLDDEVSLVGQIIVPLVGKGFFQGIFQNVTIFSLLIYIKTNINNTKSGAHKWLLAQFQKKTLKF
jgi:hypothetical protein